MSWLVESVENSGPLGGGSVGLATKPAPAKARGGDNVTLRSWTDQELRILNAVRICFAKWGISKTTVEDVARQAGMSRATLYRIFPEGRDSIIESAIELETGKFFNSLCGILEKATTLRELLANGLAGAWELLENDEILAFLLAHEPEVVLRNLAFDRLEELIAICREILAPYLSRWLDKFEADRLAEWAARVVVSYAIARPDWSSNATDTAQRLVGSIFAPHFQVIGYDIDEVQVRCG